MGTLHSEIQGLRLAASPRRLLTYVVTQRSGPSGGHWTTADIPDLSGLRAIVTGANSGIGLETARALTHHGASVTLAVRDTAKGQQALAYVGDAQVRALDLADLSSVRTFAGDWSDENPEGLDLLINNAGVMALPRMETADGFEMQLGTNHLGHFALTGLLFPALVARPGARVVTVSSQAHRMGRITFNDLMGKERYRRWGAYGQSKLANLLFTSELQRRVDAHGIALRAMAAHPGYSNTNLQSGAARAKGGRGLEERVVGAMNQVLGQSPQMGALPTLFAATAPGLPGDTYVGPDGFLEQRGHPRVVNRSAAAKDSVVAAQLWKTSEALTGIVYPFG